MSGCPNSTRWSRSQVLSWLPPGFSSLADHRPLCKFSLSQPKRLGELASTTAIIATFLPCFIAAIGWGRLPGVGFTGCCAVCLRNGHNKNQEIKVATRITCDLSTSIKGFGSSTVHQILPLVFVTTTCGGGCRMRGMGGGTSGNASNSTINWTAYGSFSHHVMAR